MRYVGSSRERSIEHWSGLLFLLAGVLLLGHAATWAVRLFADAAPPTGHFAAAGHLVAVAGLVAFSPVPARRTPSLARAGALVATVPAVGWFVIAAEQLAGLAGVLPASVTALPAFFYVGALLSTTVVYALFAVIGSRAGFGSGAFRLLLLAPAVLLVAGTAAQAVVGASAAVGFATGVGLARSFLAVGHRLRRATSAERGAPGAGLTTG